MQYTLTSYILQALVNTSFVETILGTKKNCAYGYMALIKMHFSDNFFVLMTDKKKTPKL